MTGPPAPGAPAPDPPIQSAAPPAPGPLTITRILLLDPHGHDPTEVESITFGDRGIGVVRARGQDARLLPWDAVVAHAVEPWAGGVIPEWWVDPAHQLPDRPETSGDDAFTSLRTNPDLAGRQLPHADAGAMISIQTRTGTYRFLRSGGDPYELAARVSEIAVSHQGPAGVSTVTTVAAGRARHYRRGDRGDRAGRAGRGDRASRGGRDDQGARGDQGDPAGRAGRGDRAQRQAERAQRRSARSGWERARPVLLALLVVVIAAAVAVILLQSAGAIHLPFLGGGASAGVPVPTTSG